MEKKITLKEAIQEWKKLNISECEMRFDCGGDSMGDYSFDFTDNDENNVESELLDRFFENEVFKNVDFYEASDGHYIGENGSVFIELSEDESEFTYSKQATAEFSEQVEGITYIKLTKKEIELIKSKVRNILGDNDRNNTEIEYKGDVILTDNEDNLLDKIKQKIHDFADDFYPSTDDIDCDDVGDDTEWFNFRLRDEDDELEIKDNKLKLIVVRNYYVYRESE